MKKTIADFISILFLGTIGLVISFIPGFVAYSLVHYFSNNDIVSWIGGYIFSATATGWFGLYVHAYITAYEERDDYVE